MMSDSTNLNNLILKNIGEFETYAKRITKKERNIISQNIDIMIYYIRPLLIRRQLPFLHLLIRLLALAAPYRLLTLLW